MNETNDGYTEKSDQIRQLASLPADQIIGDLTDAHPGLDTVAPNLAPHVYATAGNAIQFLNSKLPTMGNELPQDTLLKPSQVEKKAWLEMHAIANDPLQILKHVENNTLSDQHLDAIQSIYPEVYVEMVNKVKEHLGAMDEKQELLPYQKRLSISRFIGEPLDSTMTQESMQAIIQSASANRGPEATAMNQKASGTTLTQINKTNKIYPTREQAKQLNRK